MLRASSCPLSSLPVALYNDPFRGGNNKLVMCETIKFDRVPTESNKRATCKEVMAKASSQAPWFGIEQVSLQNDYLIIF